LLVFDVLVGGDQHFEAGGFAWPSIARPIQVEGPHCTLG
jgi:hypothetical protein